MSFILNVSALVGVSLFLSLRFRDSLSHTVPVTLCSTLLLLYILAFFRKMSWIDGVSALCLIALLVLFVLWGRRDGFRSAAKRAAAPLRDIQIWINLAVLILVAVLVNYRQILEWDAYNFWGADIKNLFYRDGFAEKYSNPAPAFGDYPPLMQLAVWWFMHLFGRCEEGLMFSGYYFFGTLLLLSLTGRLRFSGTGWKIIGGIAAAGMLFILPSVADTSWYRTLCADPIMAILFGCLLVEITGKQHSAGFGLYKCAVLGAAVCLTKSIGFMWAAFGIIFFLVWKGFGAGNLRKAAVLLGSSGACYISWTVFCRVMARTTVLSDNISSTVGDRVSEILNGTFLSAGDNLAYIKSFIKAFLFAPTHLEKTSALDLTPALVLLLILGMFFLFCRGGWLTKKETAKISVCCVCIYAITCFILLCGHLTIFYAEKKYTDPLNMVVTLTRYGCPASIGFLMLAFSVGAEHLQTASMGRSPAIPLSWVLPVLIVLSAGYNELGRCMIQGVDQLNPQRIQFKGQLQETMSDFLDETAQTVRLEGEGQRVLLLIEEENYNPIISYLASPVSVQKFTYKDGDLTAEGLAAALDKVGAGWFYVQDAPGETLRVLKELVPGFEMNTLYSADVLK